MYVATTLLAMYFFFSSLKKPTPLGIALGIMFGVPQVLLVLTGSNPNTSSEFSDFSNRFAFIQLDFSAVGLPIECFTQDFTSTVIIHGALPAGLMVAFGTIFGLSCLVTFSSHRAVGRVQKYLPTSILDVINAYIFTHNALFITITAAPLKIFRVGSNPSGQLTVLAFPAVIFGSEEWRAALPVSLVCLGLFSVFFLAVYAYLALLAPRYCGLDRVRAFRAEKVECLLSVCCRTLELLSPLTLSPGSSPFFQRAFRCLWANFDPTWGPKLKFS